MATDPNVAKFKANNKGIKAHMPNRGCGGKRGPYGSSLVDSEDDFFAGLDYDHDDD